MADEPNQPWCIPDDVWALPAYASLENEDDTLLTLLCLVASTWLWRATGRQFAGLSGATVVRPVSRWHCGPTQGHYGSLLDVSFFNSATGQYGWAQNAGRSEGAFEVSLGFHPVRGVSQVVIDGAVFTDYRLDDDGWLVRTDGGSWPSANDWAKDSTVGGDPGTWQVTLTWGADPPADAVHAAKILAGELGLANTNSDQARLNPRIQSVVRQGESMLLMDPQMLIQGEKWGVKEIDDLVAMLNPHKLQMPTAVLSPDIPRAVRRAGT